jgi:hypothetical protein
MTNSPGTIPDLDAALTSLTDDELLVFLIRMSQLACGFAEDKRQRVADLFASLMLCAADEQDRRRDLVEHARRELDGDDIGGLLSEWADRPDLEDLD